MSHRRKKEQFRNLYKIVILILVAIISFLGIYLIFYSNKKEKVVYNHNSKIATTTKTTKEEKNEFSMVMVGDCLIHRFVYEDAFLGNNTYSFDKMFKKNDRQKDNLSK